MATWEHLHNLCLVKTLMYGLWIYLELKDIIHHKTEYAYPKREQTICHIQDDLMAHPQHVHKLLVLRRLFCL